MGVIAKRYAEALIDTGIELNSIEKYEQELNLALEFMQSNKVKEFLEYPGVTVDKKKDLINNLMKDKLDKNIINFLMILLETKRSKYFSEIVSEYKTLADQYRNILFIEITSASELDEDQINRIKEKISSQYGKSDIKTKIVIDASVIGGVKLKIGDTVIDGTVKTRLENLEKAIKEK